MRAESFTFEADDRKELFVYRWSPDDGAPKRAIVHIAHGMAEHAGRYASVAEELAGAGYVVYANDHRGHGRTERAEEQLGFVAPTGGFRRAVRDLEQLIAHEKRENPGLPVVLFGHSMGSFLVQSYLIEHGGSIQGAVLSGSAGKPGRLAAVGRRIAMFERWRLGGRGRSKLLDTLSFGNFNRSFSPARTQFDWLSRDPAEVDKYIADPRCGFICTTSFWVDLLGELSAIADPAAQARIPKELPLYVFGGSLDPVGANQKSVEQLLGAYRRAGLKDITHRFYRDGRHEMLNDVNRGEVTRDLLTWLDRITG